MDPPSEERPPPPVPPSPAFVSQHMWESLHPPVPPSSTTTVSTSPSTTTITPVSAPPASSDLRPAATGKTSTTISAGGDLPPATQKDMLAAPIPPISGVYCMLNGIQLLYLPLVAATRSPWTLSDVDLPPARDDRERPFRARSTYSKTFPADANLNVMSDRGRLEISAVMYAGRPDGSTSTTTTTTAATVSSRDDRNNTTSGSPSVPATAPPSYGTVSHAPSPTTSSGTSFSSSSPPVEQFGGASAMTTTVTTLDLMSIVCELGVDETSSVRDKNHHDDNDNATAPNNSSSNSNGDSSSPPPAARLRFQTNADFPTDITGPIYLGDIRCNLLTHTTANHTHLFDSTPPTSSTKETFIDHVPTTVSRFSSSYPKTFTLRATVCTLTRTGTEMASASLMMATKHPAAVWESSTRMPSVESGFDTDRVKKHSRAKYRNTTTSTAASGSGGGVGVGGVEGGGVTTTSSTTTPALVQSHYDYWLPVHPDECLLLNEVLAVITDTSPFQQGGSMPHTNIHNRVKDLDVYQRVVLRHMKGRWIGFLSVHKEALSLVKDTAPAATGGGEGGVTNTVGTSFTSNATSAAVGGGGAAADGEPLSKGATQKATPPPPYQRTHQQQHQHQSTPPPPPPPLPTPAPSAARLSSTRSRSQDSPTTPAAATNTGTATKFKTVEFRVYDIRDSTSYRSVDAQTANERYEYELAAIQALHKLLQPGDIEYKELLKLMLDHEEFLTLLSPSAIMFHRFLHLQKDAFWVRSDPEHSTRVGLVVESSRNGEEQDKEEQEGGAVLSSLLRRRQHDDDDHDGDRANDNAGVDAPRNVSGDVQRHEETEEKEKEDENRDRQQQQGCSN